MKISEVIKTLQEIKDIQGDCDVAIDSPEFNNFIYIFDITGEYYTSNSYNKGKPANQCFIVFEKDK